MADKFYSRTEWTCRLMHLFVDTKLIGVIEAKAIHKDIPSVIDYQGKEYPR